MSRRVRSLILAAAASAVVIFLYMVRGVLTPFALAAVIAYVAHPLVEAFTSRQIPRSVAIVIVYVIFAILGALVLQLVVPILVRELNEVLVALPQARSLERYSLGAIERYVGVRGSIFLREMVMASIQRAEQMLVDLAGRSLAILVGFLARASSLILAPFLAFYVLRDFDLLRRSVLTLIPVELEGEILVLARRLNHVVAGFLRGQLIVCILMGGLISIVLAALRVRYALLIGIIAGIFEIIPYFGPLIGAIPAVMLGLMRSPTTAFWTGVWIIILHQLEGAVLQPRIMSSSVGLHPLTVIFAILAGGNLLGILGMLLAVPVAATLKVVGGYVLEKISSQAG